MDLLRRRGGTGCCVEIGGVASEKPTRFRAHIHHMAALVDAEPDAGPHCVGDGKLVDEPLRREVGRHEVIKPVDDQHPCSRVLEEG